MKVVIALTIVFLLVGASKAADPVEAFRKVLKGFFMQFQRDINTTQGCYNRIGRIYDDIGLLIRKIQNFTMNELPRVVAAITDIIYRCIDLDGPCRFNDIYNATLYVIEHPEIIMKRLDTLTIISIINDLQKGILLPDFELLGKAIGLFCRKVLNIQL